MRDLTKLILTGAVVVVAVAVFLVKYWQYVVNPWTRDGQVRAQVIQITPRVSAPIVKLPIEDNQLVTAGDLLFELDPRTFEADLRRAKSDLDQTRDEVASLLQQVEAERATVEASAAAVKQGEAALAAMKPRIRETKQEYERQKKLLPQGATSKRAVERAQSNYEVNLDNKNSAEAELLEAKASLAQSNAELAKAQADLGAPGDDNAQIRSALAAVHQAELNLEFTQVKAPVDGYVTNLTLRLGSQGVANQPALALVDINSYWIHGFFRENYVGPIRKGDQAVVTLMSYPDQPLTGRVDSIGWGIAQDDGSTGFDLLPTISPTFEWIRLAQRIPVRIHLDEIPDGVELRVGTTASVLIRTGTADRKDQQAAVAAPPALQ